VPIVAEDDDLAAWRQRRAELLRVLKETLGDSDAPPCGPHWETVEVHAEQGLELRRVRYRLAPDEWGYAWLALPRAASLPAPCVIVLHQTAPQGKDEPMGLSGEAALAYGRNVAERGFAVLAPDALGFGERAKGLATARYHSPDEFFRDHPDGSVMGRMCYDLSRTVDVLECMPEIDATRIGCIGHSHGGYGTLFGMALEPRIAAGVSSCGFTGLRDDPTPERWWRRTALIPRLGLYEDDIVASPWDFHHILALIAPRPLLVVAALDDAIFPNTRGVAPMLEAARAVYALHGAREALSDRLFAGPHGFPEEARADAYRMLAAALRKEHRG
jgi:dienelactone hydrolase